MEPNKGGNETENEGQNLQHHSPAIESVGEQGERKERERERERER